MWNKNEHVQTGAMNQQDHSQGRRRGGEALQLIKENNNQIIQHSTKSQRYQVYRLYVTINRSAREC